MKKILISLLMISVLSCNYEKINTDIYGVKNEEYNNGDLPYGASLQSIEQNVISIGSPSKTTGPGNEYQATDILASGSYIGFYGNNNNWNNSNEASWFFSDNRMEFIYKILYKNVYRDWLEINKLVANSNEPKALRLKAVADLIRIFAWVRATDMFGPIIYTQAGKGDISPKLDSQQTVYTKMLEDLDAISLELNKSNANIIADYDLVYEGNAQKWVKLANSLMLRLAVRVHFVDEDLARTYVAKALDMSRGGVLETVDHTAKVCSSPKLDLLNPVVTSIGYDETKMGLTMWSYMTGYNDSRISIYYTEGSYDKVPGYYAIAPVNIKPKDANDKNPRSIYFASSPKVDKNTPVYWMRASEVYFLRAEAALYNLSSEDVKSMYEKGVRMSFEEWGVTGVKEYLASRSLPVDVTSDMYKYTHRGVAYSCTISTGNVSPNWEDISSERDETEQKLQKIITQKFIALYPNSIEAYTEYRRTGYPYIMKPYSKGAYNNINGTENMLTPERMKFASTEYNSNPNMQDVPTLLGGEDNGATKLWWVRSNRPVQPK